MFAIAVAAVFLAAPALADQPPSSSVAITNALTPSVVLGGTGSVWQLEPVGGVYKLKSPADGQVLVLADWARGRDEVGRHKGKMLDREPDSEHPTTLWRFERAGRGFWIIAPTGGNAVLEVRQPNPYNVVRKAALRKSDRAQMWKIEPARE
jgi:hypothetical protein